MLRRATWGALAFLANAADKSTSATNSNIASDSDNDANDSFYELLDADSNRLASALSRLSPRILDAGIRLPIGVR
jgi:hypothetical protein